MPTSLHGVGASRAQGRPHACEVPMAKRAPETVIAVDQAVKRFKNLTAVDGLSLHIQRGEFVALLGPNGAGKTTLVEMIEGIQTPDSGSIRIFGKDWKQHERELQNRIGVALQETRFYERLNVAETLRMFASFYGRGPDRAEEALRLADLADKRTARVVNLSGGQRQRLALGIALINEPELLLLDEPTTGLDPNARRSIWEILSRLRERGVTLILTTHYMEEAEQLCDRIVIMDRGKILADGRRERLLRELGGEIIELDTRRPPTDFRRLIGLKSASRAAPGRVRLEVDNSVRALPGALRLTAGEKGDRNLVVRRLHLDDLFTQMTGRRLDDSAAV